jgi:hypothetical protein
LWAKTGVLLLDEKAVKVFWYGTMDVETAAVAEDDGYE